MQIKIWKFIVLLFVFYNAWISAMNPVDDPAIAEIEGEIEKNFNTKFPKDQANQIATIKKLGGLIERTTQAAYPLVSILAAKLGKLDYWELMGYFRSYVLDAIIGNADSDVNKIHFLSCLIKIKKNKNIQSALGYTLEKFVDKPLVLDELISIAKDLISEGGELRDRGMSLLLELVKRGKGYDYAKEVIRNNLQDNAGFYVVIFNECVKKMSINDVDPKKDKKLWEKIVEDYNNWYVDVSAVQEQGFIYYKNIKRRNIEDEKQGNLTIIEKESTTYKIHLQVKKDYLEDFIKELLKELKNPMLYDIYIFKYTSDPSRYDHKSRNEGGSAIPMIVLYITKSRDLLNNKERDKIIDPIITELVDFVDEFCKQHKITIQDLSWPVVPRFNKKINDVVWIAGGNGDKKEGWGSYIDEACPYTKDLCFVKGHEYFTPEERLPHKLTKLKESLSGLKAKLQALAGKLGLLKKMLKPAVL